MPRRLEHRARTTHPADGVYAIMVDPDFLQERLRRIGGPGAALLEHECDTEGARYRLRQGVAADKLPSMVRSFLSGDVVIDRTERLHRDGAGRYAGDVSVVVAGAPGSLSGDLRLRDLGVGSPGGDGEPGAIGGERSEFAVDGEVRIPVPLVGGRIEAFVAEQIEALLAAESQFTLAWLEHHR